jgi:hypothetical protein
MAQEELQRRKHLVIAAGMCTLVAIWVVGQFRAQMYGSSLWQPIALGTLGVMVLFPLPIMMAIISLFSAKTWARRFGHPAGTRCCAGCGYPSKGLPEERCPECSRTEFCVVPPFPLNVALRWAVITAFLIVVGAVLADGICLIEEACFRARVANGLQNGSAARWLSSNSSLVVSNGIIHATD